MNLTKSFLETVALGIFLADIFYILAEFFYFLSLNFHIECLILETSQLIFKIYKYYVIVK